MNKNKILVPLKNNSYEVIIKAGIINFIGEEFIRLGIKNNRKILIISNREISELYGEKFLKNLSLNNFEAEIFHIKAGESHKNLNTLNVEGKSNGDWVLVDAGDIIIHLFRSEVREYYGLEKMWAGEEINSYIK